MSDSPPSQFSALLDEVRRGNEEAKAQLISLVYQDLRRIAQNCLQYEHPSPSLQATALVHEVYLRLFGETEIEWQNRQHFLLVSARQMRWLLIDHARSNIAAKRNGKTVPLEDAAMLPAFKDSELVELDEALQDLEHVHLRAAQVVSLRFFIGLTEEETALALKVSETTVKRDWKFARAWLYDRMRGPIPLPNDGKED